MERRRRSASKYIEEHPDGELRADQVAVEVEETDPGAAVEEPLPNDTEVVDSGGEIELVRKHRSS